MSQDSLFDGLPDDLARDQLLGSTSRPAASVPRSVRVENSALWAGWADALGFISELTTESGLRRRLKGRNLTDPVQWRRRVGGRSGPDVVLPAGTYSDDTQLRLATGRCIQSGQFDVEAFAHIELPSWLAYALGGGKGTKAAAARMMGPNSVWYAGQGEGWTRTGGNGAAMRIQPHVWASDIVADRGKWLAGLLADACTTHAHPRALLGAVFHAYALSLAVSFGEIPNPNSWADLFAAGVKAGRDELFDHPEIGDYWIGAFDAASRREGGSSFERLWFATADEMRVQIELARSLAVDADPTSDEDPVAATYRRLVIELELDQPDTRGSGSATVIAALWLAHAYQADPAGAARLAAADLTTDTDTIATMAAALAGAASADPPPHVEGPLDYSDRAYLRSEAQRLAAMAAGADPEPSIRYPDLLGWALPKAQVDLVGLVSRDLALAGVSTLHKADSKPTLRGNFVWSWYQTDWGQHLLVKHRTDVRELPPALAPAPPAATARNTSSKQAPSSDVGTEVGVDSENTDKKLQLPAHRVQAPVALETVLRYLETQRFSDPAVGYSVRQMAASASEREFADFSRALYQALRGHR